MRPIDIITRKRDGKELSREELKFFVDNVTNDNIPDYQAAAWCMAVYLRGMSLRETIDLTIAMAESGEQLQLHHIAPFIVDKHSTGGVGDKTTLVIAPLIAAENLPVAKMSGRGLGFSGGTIDKLESIPGYKTILSKEEFMEQLARHGIVVSGQSADLAPADGKLYALRDVTATIESLPLIASSVMSKKLASGADAIVLDVKVGSGAFMKGVPQAIELARLMVDIGKGVGKKVSAIISDMNQPLGFAVGNALEVKEAINMLRGNGPIDLREHCLTIAGKMLQLAEKSSSLSEARELLRDSLSSGKAWNKFQEWITAQGGALDYIREPELLPHAPLIRPVAASKAGFIARLGARTIGEACVELGAGRQKKEAPIDHSVGVEALIKIGQFVEKGQILFIVHANTEEQFAQVSQRLLTAISWSDGAVKPLPHTYDIVE